MAVRKKASNHTTPHPLAKTFANLKVHDHSALHSAFNLLKRNWPTKSKFRKIHAPITINHAPSE